jgi:serine/threonine-protein kinase
LLKTYLLRLRAEKGERSARQLLTAAGIDPTAVDNETGWLSVAAAKRALRAIADQLGPEALRNRGEWVTHAEALGTHVRMLRVAEHPIDAYRYLSANSREVTRIGTWELEELAKADAKDKEGKKKAEIEAVRMTYRPREDADEGIDRSDNAGEELLCAARQGELISFPRIWGLPDAEVVHEQCIAKGADACVYTVRWQRTRSRTGPLVGAAAAAVACGAAISAAGGLLAGGLSAVLGGLLGGGAGFLWDRSKDDKSVRAFERNRIAALERGLELRGDIGATPGELTGSVLGGKYRIGRKIGSGGIGVVYAA